MAKRNKNNKRQKALKKKVKRSSKPDEYYQYGTIEMARFGKFIMTRNNMSEEQFEYAQDKLVEHFPSVCANIEECITSIVEIVKEYKPEEMLKRAYWEMAGKYIKIESEVDIGQDEAHAMRMIDYIQSVIVSVQPNDEQKEKVPEETWGMLSSLVDKLFSMLNQDYQLSRYAINKRSNADFSHDFEEYFFKAQIYWCNVRGDRYIAHEIPFYSDVLSPHDDVLHELYGIGVDDILNALKSIQISLMHGPIEAMQDLHNFQKDTTDKLLEKMENLKDFSVDDARDLMNEVIVENGWEKWRDDVIGRLFGLDLFDVEKVTGLPDILLDKLAWKPGEETEFFSEGEFKGWPLRIWPVFKRPFIKMNEKYYCFDIYSVHDNLYRTLQRIIKSDKPKYSVEWNEKQKEVSEDIPLSLLNRLLPGSTQYKSVYYQDVNKNWCEADGIVLFDGHMFVVEVKAGAFTYTSPATDFPAYIDSLKNLVLKPAMQGKRFLDYINSEPEVSIYDENHVLITNLRVSDYEHITICAVTLDPFTELASQAENLKQIGVDIGSHPIWSISIDDLRVYADIFTNPLIFLHFVEQRMRAFRSEVIQTEDELDHLGLYVNHNVYAKYAEGFGLDKPVGWYGYRSDIDKFFHKKYLEPDISSQIEQSMSTRLKELLSILSIQSKPGRRKVANFLLDCGGDSRDNIADGIDDVLIKQKNSLTPKPLSIMGEVKLTLFCWQEGVLPRDRNLAIDHVRAVMIGAGEGERLLLELSYDESSTLIDVDFQFVDLLGISPENIKKLTEKSEVLKTRRIRNSIIENGKIGRNDPCPCGGGEKYKNCCMRNS